MNYFWFLAGTLAGVCAAVVMLPLLRAAREGMQSRKTRIALSTVGVAAFAAAAFLLYHVLGSPESLGTGRVVATSPHPGMSNDKSGDAKSMESVVASLEARLERDGGKREDWLLLAQSYDFMGRTADAQRAREKADGTGSSNPLMQTAAAIGGAESTPTPHAAAPAAAADTTAFEKRVRAKPSDVQAWQMLAALYRRQHDYAKARDAFTHLIQLKAMDADAWADYADVLASVGSGSLSGAPSQAIDNALRLQPRHLKALWLKASLAHEERRYADALAVWRQLRAALPPDSSDVKIVDANIAEAMQLAGQPASAPTGGTEVTGTVSIDGALASRVPAGATLFIYAKDADSPGPPLAVLRQVAGTWPIQFRLDDTQAMIPSRKLSQFDRVIVEARISKSGQATPASGDLYVTSAVLSRAQRQKLALVIKNEVG